MFSGKLARTAVSRFPYMGKRALRSSSGMNASVTSPTVSHRWPVKGFLRQLAWQRQTERSSIAAHNDHCVAIEYGEIRQPANLNVHLI
jgi:hypothetical protein